MAQAQLGSDRRKDGRSLFINNMLNHSIGQDTGGSIPQMPGRHQRRYHRTSIGRVPPRHFVPALIRIEEERFHHVAFSQILILRCQPLSQFAVRYHLIFRCGGLDPRLSLVPFCRCMWCQDDAAVGIRPSSRRWMHPTGWGCNATLRCYTRIRWRWRSHAIACLAHCLGITRRRWCRWTRSSKSILHIIASWWWHRQR